MVYGPGSVAIKSAALRSGTGRVESEVETPALHHRATEDVRIEGGWLGSLRRKPRRVDDRRKLDVVPIVRRGSSRGEKPRYPRTSEAREMQARFGKSAGCDDATARGKLVVEVRIG